jgi:hypothetical protein
LGKEREKRQRFGTVPLILKEHILCKGINLDKTFFSPEANLESGNITLKYFEKRSALDDNGFNVVIGWNIIASGLVTARVLSSSAVLQN